MFNKFIRTIFLVKEIVSKLGEVHFKRYRLLQTPWFAVYIHQILRSDMDKDMHDHPWSFASIILKGSYREAWTAHPYFDETKYAIHSPGDVITHHAEDVHQITVLSPSVWTLVFTSGRSRVWGYRLADGSWIDFKKYRQIKNGANDV